MTKTEVGSKIGDDSMRSKRRCSSVAALLTSAICCGCTMVGTPGTRPVSSEQTSAAKEISADLRKSVTMLAETIGERNVYRPEGLERARAFIESEFRSRGYEQVRLQPVTTPTSVSKLEVAVEAFNIEAVRESDVGKSCTIIVGAHYDSKVRTPGWHDHGPALPSLLGTPGANDNASGVAALLALATLLRDSTSICAIRFVAFVNEEPPFFQTDSMGSLVYARAFVEKNTTDSAALSLETLGCYSPRSNSKRPFGPGLIGLPNRSDYVAFLGNLDSQQWIEKVADAFAPRSAIEVRTLAAPEINSRVAWSDDWSFWQVGIPAFAVTDTAFLRHDDYHELNDTPDRLDYEPMAHVVIALAQTLPGIVPSK